MLKFLLAALMQPYFFIAALTLQDFQENYIQEWIEKTEPNENPEFVILLGPCGSGKSSARNKIDHIRTLDAVDVNIDEIVKEYIESVRNVPIDSIGNADYLKI